MTNQEAIDIIKTAIAEVEWEYPMDYAAAFDMAVKALAKDNNVPGNSWISVKDRMPRPQKNVLAYFQLPEEKPGIGVFFLAGDRWFDVLMQSSPVKDNIVTHWMPLPEPPKEG